MVAPPIHPQASRAVLDQWSEITAALVDREGALRPVIGEWGVTVDRETSLRNAGYHLSFLAQAPSFSHMLQVLLWFSFLYGLYNGAMIPALTEIMPVEVRVAGFSLAYSLATAVFGGFTPAVSTWLIHLTGDKAAPAYWMTFAAVCALCATLVLYRNISARLQPAM